MKKHRGHCGETGSSIGSASLVEWLLAEGGVVIRWLTLTQLANSPPEAQVRQAMKNLLNCPNVQLWLGRLEKIKGFHSSGNDCLENATGKLGEFGLRAGMKPLDTRMKWLLDWLANSDHRSGWLDRIIACAGLLRLGYAESDAVRDFALTRLDQLYGVAAGGRYDIFLLKDPPDMPKAYRGRYRTVAPEFTPDGASLLPCIHDIYMLANLPDAWLAGDVRMKINAVVKYILTDKYQALPQGYGYLRQVIKGKSRYYALGWNVNLPGWAAMPPKDGSLAYFFQRLELMSHFAEARKTAWWSAAMKLVESFRNDDGKYLFPREWLQEKPVGYWVTGAHMGLEEGRRTKKAIQLESTFRAVRLLKKTGGAI